MSLTAEELCTRVDIDDYKPRMKDGEHRRFETYGKDLEIVCAADPHHVWTCISCDDACDCGHDEDPDRFPDCDCATLRIVAGYHFVNRFYYLITKKPWITGEEWD